jgi:hypothetical protein
MKVKIRLALLGHVPHSSDIQQISKWNSSIFEVIGIGQYAISGDSDRPNWQYSDDNINGQLPGRQDADVLLAITNVPIQQNFYARRFSDNRVCLTYNEMAEILASDNIPQVNLVLKVLYAISIVYKKNGNRVPVRDEDIAISHDETRGCIFDMNGIKTDIIYSLNKPQICNECVQSLINNHVAVNRFDKESITKIQKELKKINKGSYYSILDLIKKYPYWAIAISSVSAILLGMIGSILASFVYHPK